MSLFDPRIVPWHEGFRPKVEERARMDGHEVIEPTHLVTKDGEPLGVLSVGRIPLVLVWMDTKRAQVRDSLAMINFVENVVAPGNNCPTCGHLAGMRARSFCIPCTKSSPYIQYLNDKRAGYFNVGPSDLLFKTI